MIHATCLSSNAIFFHFAFTLVLLMSGGHFAWCNQLNLSSCPSLLKAARFYIRFFSLPVDVNCLSAPSLLRRTLT